VKKFLIKPYFLVGFLFLNEKAIFEIEKFSGKIFSQYLLFKEVFGSGNFLI
jgi:hypothetical protein